MPMLKSIALTIPYQQRDQWVDVLQGFRSNLR